MAVDWDEGEPLARVEGESRVANQALRDYARLGVRRSLRGLLARYASGQPVDNEQTEKPPTTKWTTLSNWSTRFAWQERVRRFDELELAREQAEWDRRRAEQREREWQLASQLGERAVEMLGFALYVEAEDEEGNKVKRATNWRMRDAAALADTSSKLARLSAGMSTERSEVQVSGSAQVVLYLPSNGRDADAAEGVGADGGG